MLSFSTHLMHWHHIFRQHSPGDWWKQCPCVSLAIGILSMRNLFILAKWQNDGTLLTVEVELHCRTMAAIHCFKPLLYFPPISFRMVCRCPPCIDKLSSMYNSVMLVRGDNRNVVQPLTSDWKLLPIILNHNISYLLTPNMTANRHDESSSRERCGEWSLVPRSFLLDWGLEQRILRHHVAIYHQRPIWRVGYVHWNIELTIETLKHCWISIPSSTMQLGHCVSDM